jgi:PAS domain-containing protein
MELVRPAAAPKTSDTAQPHARTPGRDFTSRIVVGDEAPAATILIGFEPRRTHATDQPTAILVVNEYLDLLERMQKEGPLRFKEAFERSPPGVGVHELDREMRVVRVSPEELRLLGYRAEDIVGASCGRSS